MFGFVDQAAADAAMRGDAATVANYLDANPNQLDNRTIFQSTLLHIAARNGRLQVAVEVLKRGIDVNALDYGGMRRTALHWACQGGHVRMVELLMEFGADTKIWCSHDILLEQQQVQGKSWSKLVQGRKCGQLIKSDEAIDKSPAEVCSNNSVRLALERLEWSPEINHMFPPRFKEMVQIVLQSLDCRKDAQAAERPSDLPAACPSPRAGPAAVLTCSSNQGAPGSLTSQASEGGRSMLESSDLPGSSQCSRVAFFLAEMPPAGASAEQTGHGSSVVGKGAEAADIARPLSWDSCQLIIALAAYPISAWL